MATGAKYLMQCPSGYVQAWTQAQANRVDMLEIPEEEALKRLKDQKRGVVHRTDAPKLPPQKRVVIEVDEAPDAGNPPTEIKGLEKGQELDVQDKPDAQDGSLAMLEEIRRVGKGKGKIEQFMRETYNINIDRKLKLSDLVDQAIARRKQDL